MRREPRLTWGVGVENWRRGRDSNPRYGCPYAAFRVRCDRPLCHLSVAAWGGKARSVAGDLANGGRGYKLLAPPIDRASLLRRLAEPADNEVGDGEVVFVQHQHMG